MAARSTAEETVRQRTYFLIFTELISSEAEIQSQNI